MSKIAIDYEGNLRTRAVHQGSGAAIQTDAPKDNHGKGELCLHPDVQQEIVFHWGEA